MSLREYDAAETFFDKSPDRNPEWSTQKGLAYIEQEKWSQALAVYQEALQIYKKAPTQTRENW